MTPIEQVEANLKKIDELCEGISDTLKDIRDMNELTKLHLEKLL